ncbi:MAG: 30S ribosomal protein THX [Salibacteraceae bacterium]
MGKGDKKSAKGKRIIGSSGVSRQKKKNTYVAPAAPVKKATPKKAAEAKPKKAAAKKPAAKKAAPKKAAAKKPAAKKE